MISPVEAAINGGTTVSLKIVSRQLASVAVSAQALAEPTFPEVSILELSGTITLGDGSMALRDAIRVQLAGGTKYFLLNLYGINYIDSSGIAELVSAFTTVRSHGGDLKLVNPNQKILDLLQLTRICTIIDIFNDEDVAIGSFGR